MAITVHSSPPTRLVAGDVYHWQEVPANIADVSSYVITFRSISDSSVDFSVTGADETTQFKFELDGATTSALDGDEFAVTHLITYSWGRETSTDGKLILLDNPTADPTKSYNQRMVDLLEAHIEGRLPEGLESHTIGGVPINKVSFLDAQTLLSDYRARLEAERNDKFKRENPDKASGNTVHIHF
jgi:hypothetical protein